MKIVQNFTGYSDKTPLALSIGMFDGVHLGHQSIIKRLNDIAKRKDLQSALLTFWPHPRTIFNPNDDLKLLNTLDEKTYLLEKHGIKNVFLKEFDDAFRNLSGDEFVWKILVETLHVKHLIIGHDHTFGKNKSGDFNLLQKLSSEAGFTVEQVEAVDFHEKHISSTQIRNALLEGNINTANEMLGYHYSLSGKVVSGKQLGRTIGYPTANIQTDTLKLLPKKGAYIVEVHLKNKKYRGMISVGTNPTVGKNPVSTEVHILNFEEDIYGENISVNFREFLHEEIKFENLQKLTERLDEDRLKTENFKF